jgi:hypothetical protein
VRTLVSAWAGGEPAPKQRHAKEAAATVASVCETFTKRGYPRLSAPREVYAITRKRFGIYTLGEAASTSVVAKAISLRSIETTRGSGSDSPSGVRGKILCLVGSLMPDTSS